MRQGLWSASQLIDIACRRLAVGFLGLTLLLVIFQVVARYIFQNVPPWTEEAARYGLIWGGLLGATSAFRANADPRLFPIPRTGARSWVVAAQWLRAVATLVFLGPILYHADRFLLRTWQRTTDALGIPSALVTVAVPLAVAIIFFHLLVQLLNPPHPHDSPQEPLA